MKVLAISGSPRTEGNTEIALKFALDVLQDEGIETEFISVAGQEVKSCIACYQCKNSEKPKCVRDDPFFEHLLARFLEADGILVGSPVYFGSATPQIMSILDRVGFVARKEKNLLKHKVGAAIAVARRAGQNFTFAQLNFFFLISEMIVPGSTYWNVGFGLQKGDIRADEEAVQTIENLAKNMAWLIKKLKA